MNESPLVTCLCLTMAGRKEFLKRAVECFRSQTYGRRELFIYADSMDDIPDEVLDSEPEDDAVIFISRELESLNVGQKRNRAIEESSAGLRDSNLIAIWDDDDFSAPNRLAQQVAELKATSKAVTGYRSMKFVGGDAGPFPFTGSANWWRFDYPRGLVFGSSLVFTRDWWRKHPFPELQIGEDVQFVEAAAKENQLSDVPDLNLMYASIHEGNTSPRRTDQAGWVKLEGFVWGKK